MALTHGDVETVVGIAVSGIPFATVMADFIEDMTGLDTSIAIFHPNKHRKDADATDDEGTISTNFGSVEGKKSLLLMTSLPVEKLQRSYPHC